MFQYQTTIYSAYLPKSKKISVSQRCYQTDSFRNGSVNVNLEVNTRIERVKLFFSLAEDKDQNTVYIEVEY